MNVVTPITETEIASLVERFYAKVRLDPEIGPVFNDEVENWDAHLALLKDFWSTVLLTTGRYKGNPLFAHPLAHRGEEFCSLADAVLRDGERGDVLAGCNCCAQGGPYRDEHEASSRIAEMTGLRRTFLSTVKTMPAGQPVQRNRLLRLGSFVRCPWSGPLPRPRVLIKESWPTGQI